MWQAIANLEPWSGHDIQDLNNRLNSGLGDQPFWLKLVVAFLRFSEHKHRHILFVMFLEELVTYRLIRCWLSYNVGSRARYLQCVSWHSGQISGFSHRSKRHCLPSLGSFQNFFCLLLTLRK